VLEALICDAVRTAFGRYGGALAGVRADDLAAMPMRALLERNPGLTAEAIEDVIYGCANQAGEDNRNVARMAALLAGLPVTTAGVTVNRLCGSSLEAIAQAARALKCGEAEVMVAGGVESMSRAPFVVAKAETAYSRSAAMYDTTLGWRFINPNLQARYGTDSMAETGENVAEQFGIARADQDAFALRSQQRWQAAQAAGAFGEEVMAVRIAEKRGERVVNVDEHPRPDSTLEGLAKLKPIVKPGGTVTAGNASGINDGAAAVLMATAAGAKRHGLRPMARVVASAVAGVEPRIMGMGPAPATRKALARAGLGLEQMDVIELNEAFAAQALAVTRELGLADDDARVNAQGGAIAIGHPLGASGARLGATACWQLRRRGGRYALCTMCIGVGQGIAVILERVG
jgi:acetyl-CoA acyltransferase